MAHVKITGHTTVPVEQWWDLATDLRRLPEWHTQVIEVRDVVGDGGVGTSATLILKQPDGAHEYRAEIAELEPLRLVRQIGREVRPGSSSYVSISRCSPVGGGGSEWEWEQEVPPPKGPLGAMTDRLMVQPVLESSMRQSMERLTALTERLRAQPV